jgi:hypothetical protein
LISGDGARSLSPYGKIDVISGAFGLNDPDSESDDQFPEHGLNLGQSGNHSYTKWIKH